MGTVTVFSPFLARPGGSGHTRQPRARLVIIEEYILPIIAPLSRMMRFTRNNYPCNSSHAHTLTHNTPPTQEKNVTVGVTLQ